MRVAWCLAVALAAGCAVAPTPVELDLARLSADGQSTLQVVGTRLALQETQTATALYPTSTPTASATPTPTATGTNTPTATMTATPLPSGVVKAAGPLRSGPGRVYSAIASLKGGETARPLGQTEAGDWYLLSTAGTEGWLPSDNFALEGDRAALPIIDDIPPTPTATATTTPTATPPPTATNTPSPYTCDFVVQQSTFPGHVILIGSGWPPAVDLELILNNTWSIPGAIHTGGADSQVPFGFWHTMRGYYETYTLRHALCSRTVSVP